MNKLLFRMSLACALTLLCGHAHAQTAQPEEKPGLVKALAPTFPNIVWAAGQAGKVVIKVTVGSDGRVTGFKVVSSHPLLEKAAVDAARKWTFSPSEKKSVERFAELEFIFTPGSNKEEAGIFFMPPFRIEVVSGPAVMNF